MLALYQFPRHNDGSNTFPNLSPFCVKLETYLKIANIPYKNVFGYNFTKNPKGQMPYIALDNKIIGDSSLIIDELIKTYGDKIDNHLSDEQKAISVAYQCLLENHLTDILIYFRWINLEGWQHSKAMLFGKIPCFFRNFIANRLLKKISSRLRYSKAIAKFSEDELLHFAAKDFDALSKHLGDKKYFFGDKISAIDALIFGVFGGITLVAIPTKLQRLANKYTNLQQHAINISNIYYQNTPQKDK